MAVIVAFFLLLVLLVELGLYFFAPAPTAKNSGVAMLVTGLTVIAAFILGFIKKSDRQLSYGWFEVLAGAGWRYCSIAFFLSDPPEQPIFVSRAVAFLEGVYLLRQ